MVGDGEAVGFVADALDQVEALGAAVEADRVGRVDLEEEFLALGQSGEGDVVDGEVAHHVVGGRDLALAAVDDDEVGDRAPALGVGLFLVLGLRGGGVVGHVEAFGSLGSSLFTETLEAALDDLGH